MKHKDSQAGNVFFALLLGITLLAALSLTVAQSLSVKTSFGTQSDKVAATRIVAYGNMLRDAVARLRQNGISEGDISFANTTVTGYGTVDANPPAEVFNASGGAIAYEAPDQSWLDKAHSAQAGYGEWRFTAANAVRNVGTPISPAGTCTADATCKDLVVVLPYIKKSICAELAKMLNFRETDNSIPIDETSFDMTKFAGTYPTGSDHLAPASTATSGKTAGCVEGGGTPAAGTYHYFQVLMAR